MRLTKERLEQIRLLAFSDFGLTAHQELLAEIDYLEDSFLDMGMVLRAADKERDHWKSEYHKLDTECAAMALERDQLKAENEKLKGVLCKNPSEVKSLHDGLVDWKFIPGEVEALREDVVRLRRENVKLDLKCEDLSLENGALEEERDELARCCDAHEDEINYMKTQFQPHPTQESYDLLKAENEKLKFENEYLKSTLAKELMDD